MGFAGWATSQEATPPPQDVVPDDVVDRALENVAFDYGPTSAIYGTEVSTRGDWTDLEPGNTRGLLINSLNDDAAVYALFIEGSFVIEDPMADPGEVAEVTYPYGRIVVDAEGDLLAVDLWPEKRAAAPFGWQFDES